MRVNIVKCCSCLNQQPRKVENQAVVGTNTNLESSWQCARRGIMASKNRLTMTEGGEGVVNQTVEK